MDRVEAARCAAENAIRRELMRFTIKALGALPPGADAKGMLDVWRTSVLTALNTFKGEALAPFTPELVGADLAAASNEAARAVVEEYERLFRAAVTGE